MKFTDLEIENFLAITNAKLSLADRGLTLIQGVNHDDTSAESNGAGKSTIGDALSWCWFGVTARGVSGDDVISHKAGKGTRVSSTAKDGDDTYVVTRHRKHAKGKNSLTLSLIDASGRETDLTKGTDKLTQDVVTKVLGASFEVFRAAVYLGQEQMPDLPAMTDKNLKILIEEASGVMLLEEAYKEARLRANAVQEKADALVRDQSAITDRIEWHQNALAGVQAQSATWHTDQLARIAAAKLRVTTLVTSVKALDAELAKTDLSKLEMSAKAREDKLATIATETKKLAELEREVSRCDAELRIAERNQVTADKELERADKALQDVKHQIGCPCDECGRPLTEAELAATTKARQAELKTAVSACGAAGVAVREALVAQEAAVAARDTYAKGMTDTTKTSAELKALRDLIAEHKDGMRERANQAQRAKDAGDEYKRLVAETNPHQAGIDTHLTTIDGLKTKQKSAEAAIDAQKVELDLANTVVKVFAPAGVRAQILDEVTPFLNTQTSKYLSILSDGNIEANWTTLVRNAKGELREKFAIEVTNDKGGKSFAAISGGEKRKVRIAASLALQDLVSTRAVKPIELFIGDEIDDALDQAGLERLTQVLEEKATERGSVLVISHNDLKDWISSIIMVDKKGGEAKVTEMTA